MTEKSEMAEKDVAENDSPSSSPDKHFFQYIVAFSCEFDLLFFYILNYSLYDDAYIIYHVITSTGLHVII